MTLPLLAKGKVREIYELGDDLLMVASDRISTYDAIHPTPIPDKGKVLTGLSVLWFGLTADIVPNHLISVTDGVPGDVLTLEPGCYRVGFGGCRLEDLVLVTDDGSETLTNFPYDLGDA